MTALTQDRNTNYSLGDLLAIPVAAGEEIFAGSLVCSNASGYGLPAADSAGLKFEGVATEHVDNSGGADGELTVVVRRRGRYRFGSANALNQAALSATVYAVDDQTVAADSSDVSNNVTVGLIDKVEGTDECWISIDGAVLSGGSWTEPTTTTAAPTTTTTTAGS